ncbi:hypothetical protein LK07_16340 [Streptomyces pluripotens]|uniref:Uncharacterized protein n=1 Tax=Streptomyces pluripotens TaxID=1355015 RepID=A0A221NZL6_9ACTN|nr:MULTISPECIES: hypothetical protein [Streptomyces]ARP71086.1 hypothetical protein LK06_015205 [Streptomyces pluripotens]ASN25334.1 hypothetical protein LK07_16340 [Streptomyces pluripotens]KIE25968.1 hypothetical protein LK08_16230 [Streptomyces sp. MUSC 125]MCH0557139.1 hypothetical protein [Streptomyces sp. MUM 16J]
MPGTVLLLAAAPLGRGRLVDAAGVLPVLAAVAPGVLSGSDTANVIELADPLEPQAVLTRLRAAAAAPGPLTVYVTGQLHLDRRQRLPHLALARTTAATVRYTALPWHWIREELRLRSAAQTALVADLHADAEAWQYVVARGLDCGPNTTVHGRVVPAPRTSARRGPVAPAYMKAVATLLRSGHRPPLEVLHERALARIADASGPGDLVLAHRGGVAAGSSAADPHAAISAAVQAGRHAEADALAAGYERAAVQAHGPASEDALHWSEVRADLAMFAGDPARSCRAWLGVAGVRLAAGQAADTPAVEAAVDRAHHQWGRITNAVRARELGPALAEVRIRVPGRRNGALENVQRHLRQLQTQ